MINPGTFYIFSLLISLCVLFGINFLFRKGTLVAVKILAIQFLIGGLLIVASFYILPENILQYPYFFEPLPLFTMRFPR